MEGIRTKLGFLDFYGRTFYCPYCEKKYLDEKEKYGNRIDANKSGITKVQCTCGQKFGVSVTFKSELVTFKLLKHENNINSNPKNVLQKIKS